MRATFVAANDDAQRHIEHLLGFRSPLPVDISRDARAVLGEADAAAIASGTAVLEAALLETPALALYVLSTAQVKIARRVYRGKYITLPNLVLDEPLVPELVQEAATPSNLADGLLALLAQPARQRDGYARMRGRARPARRAAAQRRLGARRRARARAVRCASTTRPTCTTTGTSPRR